MKIGNFYGFHMKEFIFLLEISFIYELVKRMKKKWFKLTVWEWHTRWWSRDCLHNYLHIIHSIVVCVCVFLYYRFWFCSVFNDTMTRVNSESTTGNQPENRETLSAHNEWLDLFVNVTTRWKKRSHNTIKTLLMHKTNKLCEMLLLIAQISICVYNRFRCCGRHDCRRLRLISLFQEESAHEFIQRISIFFHVARVYIIFFSYRIAHQSR